MRVRAFIHEDLKHNYQESVVSDSHHVLLEVSNWARKMSISVIEDKGVPYGFRLEFKYLEGDPNRYAESIAVFKNDKLDWLKPTEEIEL